MDGKVYVAYCMGCGKFLEPQRTIEELEALVNRHVQETSHYLILWQYESLERFENEREYVEMMMKNPGTYIFSHGQLPFPVPVPEHAGYMKIEKSNDTSPPAKVDPKSTGTGDAEYDKAKRIRESATVRTPYTCAVCGESDWWNEPELPPGVPLCESCFADYELNRGRPPLPGGCFITKDG